ncbi:MAG: iron-sulfur cluster assembly protein, partial [Gammaproteobacteria bacterium]|nr:iron-sulfur cluster assembly protein [Gammaproteobacteria bacterium]
MAEVTREQIEAAIKGYVEPHMEKNLVDAKCVKAVEIDGGSVKVTVELGFPCDGTKAELAGAVKERVQSVDGVTSVEVNLGWKVVA